MSPPAQRPPPRRGRPGPAPSHTLEDISAAAVAVADAEGLGGVTMRSVATAVGMSAPGLYRYVASRDELVALMVDRASAEVHHPNPSGDWVGDVTEVAEDQVRVFRAHPWLVGAVGSLSSLGPHVLDHLDWGLDVLRDVDATVQHKLEAIALVNGFAALFSSSSQPGPEAFSHLDPRRHPRLTAALAGVTATGSSDDLFARVVAGLLHSVLEENDAPEVGLSPG